MTSPYTRSITAVESLDGFLLDDALGGSLDHDEALGGCLDPDEGFCGRHVAHQLGGEQLDDGFCGLDKLLMMLPGPPQRARLECGAVWQSFKLVGRLLLTRLPDPIFK